jgi:hypothetical protein
LGLKSEPWRRMGEAENGKEKQVSVSVSFPTTLIGKTADKPDRVVRGRFHGFI